MSDSRNFVALDWVVHEIVETLTEARDALESYVANPRDQARLRFCLTHIHQVHGSLQMVEFHGAAMMAEEMEYLAQAMLEDRTANSAEAQEVLMRAIVQFPVYLENVKVSRRDNPLSLLPLLNDLRAVRGENLLTETRLFSPHLAPAQEAHGEPLPMLSNPKQFRDTARKLRQMYQYAAAGFMRGVNQSDNLGYLKKVFERLYKLTRGTRRQAQWHICLALAEALEQGTLDANVSIKNLLRQLDQELKALIAEGPQRLSTACDEQFLKNLLYYVARAVKQVDDLPDDSYLKSVYQRYELENALPESESSAQDEDGQVLLGVPDPEALKSVVSALKAELDTIKQALDVSLPDEERKQTLIETLPTLKRMADTMAVLGAGQLRKQLLEQTEELERATTLEGVLDEAALLAFAGRMLEIESGLEAWSATSGRSSDSETVQAELNLSRAQESVLRESRSGLEQAKDAVVEYIASQWDATHLQTVPGTLREIRGGLDIVPMSRPARVIGACARFVEEQLLASETPPDWSHLDTLADAITSVEYYLERFNSEHANDNELLLHVAEERVAQLGYAVAPSKVAPVPEVPEAATGHEDELEDSEAMAAFNAAYQSATESAADGAGDASLDALEQDVLEQETSGEALADSEAEHDSESETGYSLEALTREAEALDALPQTAGSPEQGLLTDTDKAAESQDTEETSEQEDVDAEILDIFIEEAGEVCEAIDEHFPRWAADFGDTDALTEFRRAFHTLKGSGRMVGATDIGELAWSIENMLNRVLDGTVGPDDRHVKVINAVRELLPDMIAAFRDALPNPHPQRTDACARYADALSKGEKPQDLELVAAQDTASTASRDADETHQAAGTEKPEEEDRDSQLWEIFGVEALAHLQVVEQYIREMEGVAPLFTPPSDATQRALHTLKGSAHMASINPVAELATPLERFVKELRTYQVNINEDILQLLRDAVEYTTSALSDIERGEPVEIPRLGQFQARVAELREIFIAPLVRQQEAETQGQKTIDPELLAIFMAEEMNLLLDADEIIERWRQHPEDQSPLVPLQEELATLTKGALHANLPPMAELGDKLYRIHGGVLHGQIPCSDDLCRDLTAAHMALLDLVDQVAVGQNLEFAPEAVQAPLDQWLSALQETQSDEQQGASEDSEQSPEEGPQEGLQDGPQQEGPGQEGPQQEDPPQESPPQEGLEADEDDIDEEIVDIFLEEASDLLEDIDRALTEWQEDWSNPEYAEDLKRSLHTLKGGARLAGITDVGDLAHDFETLLIGMRERDSIDQAFFQRLTDLQDKIHAGVSRVETPHEGGNGETVAPERVNSLERMSSPEVDNILPFTAKAKPGTTATTAPDMPPGGALSATAGAGGGAPLQQLAARRSGPQEVVRVSAELLEDLVNLAGETSITRGRIEEQVGDLGLAIDEMDSTISRLQEQLRRLDIETEAQVLFRQEQMEAHEEFDPLEMDRYSQLQQLSRSLMESASDLLDLKNTLADKNRDTETLLLQQSRINTDLQEGLMRSRMVPFSRLVPRLRRIVRQAATELGKDVNFELDNVEGELDRSVLERMVAPLEHMLRNAVDHGIEPPADREAAGKPRTGRIMLGLSREGGEVILRLADDGRGINLERVRAKAVERGLMTEDAQLSDRDIMQFILHAGFSTADKVTQISGRGVGMDVVHSEIKQLGGSMFINSVSGSGSEFIVRLPFTVSVNRALMIQIGNDYYAVPLNTIEGIVRVSPFELEHYYSDENARFEYAGEQYRMRYLGTMLDSDTRPKLDGQSLPLPVVLVRSAEHTVALQVDRLLGSSEIVVKTLGVQFSAVSGVSGATVMGDGSVVVILDPHALIREKLALGMPNATLLEAPEAAPEVPEERERVVMVVDDSVTVRKVTGRFLEREGFRVITAKDGAEALLMLQDQVPDVMLLDIEMPRMDGFEVASNIRSSSRLSDLPIIMITSRTGDKHRERAFGIGVNKYMGKPYQEERLLSNIHELLEIERV